MRLPKIAGASHRATADEEEVVPMLSPKKSAEIASEVWADRPVPSPQGPRPAGRPRRKSMQGSVEAGAETRSRARSQEEPAPAKATSARRASASPQKRRRNSSKRRQASRTRASLNGPQPSLNEEDEQFVSVLFGVYATEYADGQPVMQAAALQHFLEALIGEHQHNAIQAAMRTVRQTNTVHQRIASQAGEESCAELQQIPEKLQADSVGVFQLECFQRVVRILDKSTKPGYMKHIISMRRDACGGDELLLARALKTMGSYKHESTIGVYVSKSEWR